MPSQALLEEKPSTATFQETTRLLLALWELGAHQTALPKGKLPDRAKKPTKTFQQLLNDGVIKVEKQKSSLLVSLEAKGVEQLAEALKTVVFEYKSTTTGAWIAKGLLKWLQQTETVTAIASTNGKAKKDAIASYEEFKSVALEVYDRLNREYNLDNLVPIYRIRREISDSVSRFEFDKWLLEMQANELFQLQGGSLPDNDPSKVEDSVTTELSGLRCYAKRLAL